MTDNEQKWQNRAIHLTHPIDGIKRFATKTGFTHSGSGDFIVTLESGTRYVIPQDRVVAIEQELEGEREPSQPSYLRRLFTAMGHIALLMVLMTALWGGLAYIVTRAWN
jgi:hypothetical protein